jgi:hypothetical protein
MTSPSEEILLESHQLLQGWLVSCTRGGKVSRNTIAVGIVVLDHMIHTCPVNKTQVISQGGEIKGARSGLGATLMKYGIPATAYLKEVTTRQGHQDGRRLFEAYEWGNKFIRMTDDERQGLLSNLLALLTNQVTDWLKRQNLRLEIDRRHAPTTWVHQIIKNAKSSSGGVVEQHLVGAKLEKRFQGASVPNFPAHAADRQTSREGDFSISDMVYHVTATPGRNVIQKCATNIRAGKYPILLIPSEEEYRAKALAEDEGIDKELTIISIEGFIALNIIELATEGNKDFFTILQEMVDIYNRRLAEVETDLSLQIEVR